MPEKLTASPDELFLGTIVAEDIIVEAFTEFSDLPITGIELTIQSFQDDPSMIDFIRIKYVGSPGEQINTDPRVLQRMKIQPTGILISDKAQVQNEIIGQLQGFLKLSPDEQQNKAQQLTRKRLQDLAKT